MFTKNVSSFGQSVLQAKGIGKIYMNVLNYYIDRLAEGPGIAHAKKNVEKKRKKNQF